MNLDADTLGTRREQTARVARAPDRVRGRGIWERAELVQVSSAAERRARTAEHDLPHLGIGQYQLQRL